MFKCFAKNMVAQWPGATGDFTRSILCGLHRRLTDPLSPYLLLSYASTTEHRFVLVIIEGIASMRQKLLGLQEWLLCVNGPLRFPAAASKHDQSQEKLCWWIPATLLCSGYQT